MEVCRDSEELIQTFRKQRNRVLELFEKSLASHELDDNLTACLWSLKRDENCLWYDTTCSCDFTSEDGVLNSRFACLGCRSLAAVSNFSKTEVLVIIPVDEIETYVLLDRHPAFKPMVQYSERSLAIMTQLITRQPALDNLINRARRSFSIEADPFSCLLLFCWSIDRIRRKAGFPILENFSGLICGRNGIRISQSGQTLQELTDQTADQLEEKSYYSKENLLAILIQIILQLQLYAKHFITLGSVNLDLLRVTPDEISYKVNGEDREFSISVFIEPSLNSAGEFYLTDVLRARLSNRHSQLDKSLERLDHCPKFNLVTEKEVTYLIFDPSTLDLFLTLRASGVSLMSGSFDFICFLFALLCYRPFSKAFSKNEKLCHLWKSCWRSSDFQIVDARVNNFYGRKNPSAEQIHAQLIGCGLRIDFLDYFAKELNKL